MLLYIVRWKGSMAVMKVVVLCVYFVYLGCVIVYNTLLTRWLFTGLTNGRCKRFYDGELPPPTCCYMLLNYIPILKRKEVFIILFNRQGRDMVLDPEEVLKTVKILVVKWIRISISTSFYYLKPHWVEIDVLNREGLYWKIAHHLKVISISN